MKCYYDFHIHSCLSPCGDNDMTPNNIVNMALIKGLDAIAVTDHNCCANLPAVLSCAKGRLVVLCGMEVESCEEVHMVCLFESFDACKNAEKEVMLALNKVKNDTEIFGEQIIMNEEDEIVGNEDNLLVTATTLSVFDIVELVHKYDGVCMAAHVDKSAYSVISNLGFIPPELDVDAIEISKNAKYSEITEKWEYIKRYNYLSSSDAHYLADIAEKSNYIDVEELTARSIIEAIKKK